MKKNPYDTLGVKPDATPEKIKKAYRKRAKSAHSDAGGSDEEMIALNEAYALLANPIRRARFDETGDAREERSTEKQAALELQTLAVLLFASGEWTQRDLLAEMKSRIHLQIENMTGKKRESERLMQRFTDAAKRMTRKDGGENFLGMAFENELHGARAAVELNAQKIEVMQSMLIQIDLFKWKADKKPQANPFANQFYQRTGATIEPQIKIWG